MPVLLDPADNAPWLDVTVPDAQELLRPYPADKMKAHMASTRVGNVKNDTADLTEPIGTDWSGFAPANSDEVEGASATAFSVPNCALQGRMS